MRSLIIVGFLLLNGICLFGQFNAYKKGFIILDNGDTLRGSIRHDVQEINNKVVYFKDASGLKKKYYSAEIKYFKRESEAFIRVTVDSINNKPVQRLLMVINDGKYKLLRYKYISLLGSSGVMDPGYTPKKYYYLLNNQGVLFKILPRKYPQVIDYYFSDRKIKGKKYRYGNIATDMAALNKL